MLTDGGAAQNARNDGLPRKKAGRRMVSDPPPRTVWQVGVDPDSGRLYASVVGEALYAVRMVSHTWKNEIWTVRK